MSSANLDLVRSIYAASERGSAVPPEPLPEACRFLLSLLGRLRGVVPSPQTDEDGHQHEAAHGGKGNCPHHLRACFRGLLGALRSLKDALGVIKRGLHVGDPGLSVLDGFFIHDSRFHLGDRMQPW
jgi:hypothetical protein